MRTLLTYVLAALAAASVFHLAPIVTGLLRGDGVPAGYLGSLLIVLPLTAFLVALVGGASWALSGFALKPFGLGSSPITYLVRGIVLFALLGVAGVVVAGSLYGSQDVTGASMIAASFSARAIPLAAAMFALMGFAWGTVFWIRAPKPTTAGIAA